MKRYIGSLLLAMVFALGLLPVTALAADTNTVYVGGVALTGSSGSIVYATTNEKGEVITEGATADNYNIKWDGSTLTLHNATIQKELNDPNLFISGSAIGVINQNGNAELTIQLEGSNTIEETNLGLSMGIYVYSSGGGAALNIKGNGTLILNSNYQTIQVISSNGNAALSIENAKVTATSSYGFGVTVRSGSSETSSASLTVNGGSLTATASSNNVSGIRFSFDSGGSGSGTPTVTVSNNATVQANGSAGGITSDSTTGVQYGTGSSTTGGIVFDGKNGTVYGNVTLQKDLTVGKDETLTIGKNASLTVPEGKKLTNNGTITLDGGKLNNDPSDGNGTIVYKVTGVTLGQPVLTLEPGTTAQIKATIEPANATDQKVSWVSSRDQVATITPDSEGSTAATVTALTPGTAEITATVDGKKAVCTVTVAHGNLVKTEAKPATCTEKGNQEYWYCDGCKRYFADDKGMNETTLEKLEIPATGHSWGEPVWSWSEDGKSCTVTFTCTKDQSHTASPTVKITSAVKTPATCQAKGVTTYTATAELDGKTYTSTKDVTDIPLGDHVAKWEGDYPATCDTNGREGTATCVVCGKVLVKDKVIPAPGHKYGEPVWTWSKDGKSCTVTFTCSVCGEKSENKATVTTKTSTEATCTQPGTATQQAQVVFNGNTYTTTKGNVTLSALGHNYKDGKCTRCGQADPNAKPAATASVTTGANGKWQTDSTQGLSFTYAGDGKFLRVQVNGTTLKEDQYQQQGNTVTLTQEYLKTLDPGSYTLVIALENSSAKTTFTVEQPAQATPVPTPQPTQQPEEQEDSEKNGNLLWIALGGGAAVLLIGGVAFLRFKRSLYD